MTTATIRSRRGTAAQWTSANPVLGLGEFGYETDTHKLKIGDGSTAWSSLVYVTGSGSGIPNGGTTGQALTKLSNTDGDANWTTLTKGSVGLGAVDNTADAAKVVLSASKWTTARTFDGVTVDGSGNVNLIGPATHGATAKTVPASGDQFPMSDSAASFGLKEVTFANLAAAVVATMTDASGGISPTYAPAWSVIRVVWNGTAWKYGTTTVTTRSNVTSRSDPVLLYVDPIGTSSSPSFALTDVDIYLLQT